jgi:hypothetical protein
MRSKVIKSCYQKKINPLSFFQFFFHFFFIFFSIYDQYRIEKTNPVQMCTGYIQNSRWKKIKFEIRKSKIKFKNQIQKSKNKFKNQKSNPFTIFNFELI